MTTAKTFSLFDPALVKPAIASTRSASSTRACSGATR